MGGAGVHPLGPEKVRKLASAEGPVSLEKGRVDGSCFKAVIGEK